MAVKDNNLCVTLFSSLSLGKLLNSERPIRVLRKKGGDEWRMVRIKGVALIGKATREQLERWQAQYAPFVEMKVKPFMEAHEWFAKVAPEKWTKLDWEGLGRRLMEAEKKLHERVIEEYGAERTDVLLNLSWLQSRKFIVFWEFEEEYLEKVIEAWINYKEVWNPNDWPEPNADGIFY